MILTNKIAERYIYWYLDLDDVDKLLNRVILNDYFQSFERIYITFIAASRDKYGPTEIWIRNEDLCMSIKLDFNIVQRLSTEDITTYCKEEFRKLMHTTDGMTVKARA